MDNAQGKLHVPGGNPLVAFDPSGKVFAIALHSQVIRLYDVASYESGPFETGAPTRDLVMAGNSPTWTSIKFSADGKKILICTNSDELYIVNGFTVETREHILTGHENRAKVDLKADFTPDAQYVMCGSQNGNIHFWDVNTGKMVASHTGHLDPPRIVAFNPRYMMAATGDATLVGRFHGFQPGVLQERRTVSPPQFRFAERRDRSLWWFLLVVEDLFLIAWGVLLVPFGLYF